MLFFSSLASILPLRIIFDSFLSNLTSDELISRLFANIFVVNKIDRPGSNQIANALEEEIQSRVQKIDWIPPVILSQANKNIGIDFIREAIQKHKNYLDASGEMVAKRGLNRDRQFIRLVENNSIDLIRKLVSSDEQIIQLRNKVKKGEINPYIAALELNQLIGLEKK